VADVMGHTRKMHNLRGDKRNVSARSFTLLPNCGEERNNGDEWRQSVSCIGEIFFMNIEMIDLYFCLHHTGRRNKTPIYLYNILVQKQDGSGSFSSRGRTKLFLVDSKDVFKGKDCAIIMEEEWRKCRNKENYMHYEIQISKTC
jgi:hypothetical protein